MILAEETYLISLDRRQERRARALSELARAGIEKVKIFSAFDGRASGLVNPTSYSARHQNGSTQMTMGEIGCYLSHLAILKMAKAKGVQSVAIFEDDIVFVSDARSRLSQFMKDVDPNWDILHFGHMHKYVPTVMENQRVYRLNFTWCLQMMVYRKKAIEILLSDPRTEAILRPIDDLICLHMPQIKCYGPFPPIALQQNPLDSDLQTY